MKHLVVTTINKPTQAMIELAEGAKNSGWKMIIIGDRKSPPDFQLPGTEYYDLSRQVETGFKFAKAVPVGHYARKNVGYLIAMANKATAITETDDDNLPLESFWLDRPLMQSAPALQQDAWINVYRYFTDLPIWPRGLPLNEIQQQCVPRAQIAVRDIACPVHQGLANENPDVDAIFRLAFPLPLDFQDNDPLILTGRSWCPFNSQNTKWFPEAFQLMYLPYHCSFRMTDIWRSFVVERILFGNGKGVLFHNASVYQDRNEHDLMKDFSDEVVGYLNNNEIRNRLLELPLGDRPETMLSDLEKSYELLIDMGLVGSDERELISAWRSDCERIWEGA